MESTMKTRMILPLLLISAAFVTPATANWFHNPYENINRNVGSAPNPTPEDLRQMRLPIAAKADEANPAAVATDAAKSPATTASAQPTGPAQAGGVGTVANASPS